MTIRQAGNPIQRDGCCRDERVAFVNKTELRDPAFHRSEVDGEGRLVPTGALPAAYGFIPGASILTEERPEGLLFRRPLSSLS